VQRVTSPGSPYAENLGHPQTTADTDTCVRKGTVHRTRRSTARAAGPAGMLSRKTSPLNSPGDGKLNDTLTGPGHRPLLRHPVSCAIRLSFGGDAHDGGGQEATVAKQ
jgi:hypothetical protein